MRWKFRDFFFDGRLIIIASSFIVATPYFFVWVFRLGVSYVKAIFKTFSLNAALGVALFCFLSDFHGAGFLCAQDATPQERVQPVQVQTVSPATSSPAQVPSQPNTPQAVAPSASPQPNQDPNAPPLQPGEPGQPDATPAEQQPEAPKPREKTYYTPTERPTGQPNLDADIKKVTVKFAFRGAAWREVLEWFADQGGMSLELETAPPGTCNYYDDKTYTLEEALDLLNGLMLRRGFTLVRTERLLMLVNLQDGIPITLVPFVTKEELDEKGKYELVRVLFNLTRTTPDVVQSEIQGLIGPQGNVLSFPKSQQIVVTETVGQLQTIRDIIQRIDDPDGVATGMPQLVTMKSVQADTALLMVKQLLGITDNDANLRTMVDSTGMKIWIVGRADLVQQTKLTLQLIDEQYAESSGDAKLTFGVYPITSADPNSVLSVAQTLLAGTPEIRLSLDPNTKSLLVYGRAKEHQIVRDTLNQMESVSYTMEVIPLVKLSATAAKDAIEKFFGTSSGTSDSSSSAPRFGGFGGFAGGSASGAGIPAPVVTADPLLKQLLVRGTTTQISQIRNLLEKMGETFGVESRSNRSTIRTIPLSSSAASLVLEQIQNVWPQISPNEIKVVTPSNLAPSSGAIPQRTIDSRNGPAINDAMDKLFGPAADPTVTPALPHEPKPENQNLPLKPEKFDDSDNAAPPGTHQNPYQTRLLPSNAYYRRAVFSRILEEEAPEGETPKDQPNAGEFLPPQPAVPQPSVPAASTSSAPAPISVSVGPNGLMISSSDPAALDQFEEIARLLSDEAFLKSTSMVVYYIKNALAESVGDSLRSLMGISSYSSGTSSQTAASPYGNTVSDPVAAILGMTILGGSKIEATGPIQITVDNRLNALFIQANVVDHRTIEDKLLPILDQLKSPEEVLSQARPHLVPLKNIRAEAAMETVKAVFARNLQGASGGAPNRGGGGQGGGAPPQMGALGALLGGGGGGGGGSILDTIMQRFAGGGQNRGAAAAGNRGPNRPEEIQTMTLAAEPKTNTLIVSAPEALFLEVQSFVEELDAHAFGRDEVSEVVVTNGRLAPAQIQSALKAIAGDSITVSNSMTSSGDPMNRGAGGQQSQIRQNPFTRGFGGFPPFGGMGGLPFGNMMNRPGGGGGGGAGR